MEKVKNQTFLLDLMPEILKHKPDAILLMLGEGGDRPLLDQKMVEVITQVAQTIRKSSQPGAVRDRLLSIADYLFVKHVFSCISEEFKQRKLSYRADRDRIREICNCFLLELTADRVNLIHGLLRLALRWKLHYPFYLVPYWVKGRKYTH